MEFIAAAKVFMTTIGPYLQAASFVTAVVSRAQAGAAQAYMYEAQAQQAMMQSKTDMLKARSEAIEWRKTGTASLRRMRAVIAATKATAAAGSLQPLSGSTGALIDESLAAGVDDYFETAHNAIIALENANVVEGAARYQRDIYNQAAANARTGGYTGAVAAGASYGLKAYEAGAFRPVSAPAPAWNQTYAGLNL